MYLKEHKIDLMVLDMIMDPGMDGLDTYRITLIISAGIVTPTDHLFAANETSIPDKEGLLPLQNPDGAIGKVT